MSEPANIVDKLLGKRNVIPEMADLVQGILTEFNGFQNFAKEWHRQYTVCTSGAAKAAMLRDITRLMVMSQEQAANNPVEGMSTEEIEQTTKMLLKEMIDAEKASST